ncbi:MAG TPA: 50S ribosomal protein L17 [Chthoniobacterales bacterium]|jgi:large subunit ribosomal protein L17|nr:50S ribosomal protein L17 [Chthoniobacterales bacterium]
MRHARKTIKLGRKSEHRNLLLANQVCSLIAQNRIKTTLAKAKAVRPFAERMITLGKRGDLHARRIALSFLRQKDAVHKLFAELAPRTADRQGGYCRIVKLGPRASDSAPMAYLEFVDQPAAETVPETKSATAKKNK